MLLLCVAGNAAQSIKCDYLRFLHVEEQVNVFNVYCSLRVKGWMRFFYDCWFFFHNRCNNYKYLIILSWKIILLIIMIVNLNWIYLLSTDEIYIYLYFGNYHDRVLNINLMHFQMSKRKTKSVDFHFRASTCKIRNRFHDKTFFQQSRYPG